MAVTRAPQIIEEGVATDAALRELLILSCHSCAEAASCFLQHGQDPELLARLVKIAIDEDDHQGDAPMEAAYLVERYPAAMMPAHAAALLRGFPVLEAGYNDALAVALAKTKHPAAQERIADAHRRGLLDRAALERAVAILNE
jgi:NaMN:DMB phosphoribosyltransferase